MCDSICIFIMELTNLIQDILCPPKREQNPDWWPSPPTSLHYSPPSTIHTIISERPYQTRGPTDVAAISPRYPTFHSRDPRINRVGIPKNSYHPAAQQTIEARKELHKLIAERNRRVMRRDLTLDWETHPVFREYDDTHDYSETRIPWHYSQDLHTRALGTRYAKIGKVRPTPELLEPAPSPSCRWSRKLVLDYTARRTGAVPWWRGAAEKEARKYGYYTRDDRERKEDFCRQLGRTYQRCDLYSEELRKAQRDRRLEEACRIPPARATVVGRKKGRGIMGWFRGEKPLPVWDETKVFVLGEGVERRSGGSLPDRSRVGRGSHRPSA